METVLKDLEAQVALYAPYCEGYEHAQLLEAALDTLTSKRLNGSRRLKPDGSHAFELSWEPGESPQDPSSCLLSFPEVPSVTYRFSVPTAQLVLWLMQVLEFKATPQPQPLPDGGVSAAMFPSLAIPAPPLPGLGIGAMPPPPLPFAAPNLPVSPQAKPPGQRFDSADLPESFWRWLLVGDLPTDPGA